ncbi:hypothetical protein [Xylophilus sp. ASV27]|uniref:hypothetical protein n=1 Tax=Xylophilus sp. ASV27 TaxID=2795129 RepID=UPI0018EAC018|nr:hypothetical protein [Xylophilus sp. ASV27]
MSNPQLLPAWTTEQRLCLHDVFDRWVQSCAEQEYEKLMVLRERIAPMEVCSIVRLVRSCYARPDLLADLPAGLTQRLREQRLLPPSSVASAAAG